jgi:hypothetical protein
MRVASRFKMYAGSRARRLSRAKDRLHPAQREAVEVELKLLIPDFSATMLTREQRRCATARALPLKERQRPVSPGGGVRRRGAKDNPPGETGLGSGGQRTFGQHVPCWTTDAMVEKESDAGRSGWLVRREAMEAQRVAESAPTSHGADPVAASRGGALGTLARSVELRLSAKS